MLSPIARCHDRSYCLAATSVVDSRHVFLKADRLNSYPYTFRSELRLGLLPGASCSLALTLSADLGLTSLNILPSLTMHRSVIQHRLPLLNGV